MSTSQWTDTHPGQMLGSPTIFKKYDMHTLKLEDLKVCVCVRGGGWGRGGLPSSQCVRVRVW